jgi:glycosyltransferase involved in cell wall biosynthesis
VSRAASDQQTEADRPAREVDVLHVITSTQRRGAETFAVDLDAALSDLGMVSDVVALTSGGPSRDGATLDVPALGSSTLAPATLRALRRRAAGAAVVVAHGSRTLPASVLALAASGVPVVYRNIGDPTAWVTGPRRRVTTRLLLGRTRAVADLWPGAADTLRAMHRLPDDKVHVVPNAVPRARCPLPDKAAGAAARAELGVPSGAPVVACIGALTAEKQVVVAVEAVARLDGVHLLVVGDGPEANAVRDRARQTAPDRIHLVGPMAGPGEALAAADVLLLTSRTEGMPGVLIEAGLSGRPAVATDVGGVSEIVRDGETGVLVPLDDVGTPGALAARVAQGVRRALLTHAELGAAARERCLAQFEIGPVAARWQALLASVAGP